MTHLFNFTMTLYKSTIVNDQGSQVQPWTVEDTYPCRRNQSGNNESIERVRKELNVHDEVLDLFVGPDCPIDKDDKVEIDGNMYMVLYQYPQPGYVGIDHIYSQIHRIR